VSKSIGNILHGSKRVQERIGFVHHHTSEELSVPLMNEIRIGHANDMTIKQWRLTKL